MRSEHDAEVEQLRGRLAAARQSFDNAAIVGTAKELVECVAKIAMTERAVTFSDSTKAPEIVDKALRTLDLPPRLTDPGEDELGRLVKGLSDAGRAIFDLRNRVGTGHGRTTTPAVSDELANLAADAAEVWVNWVLHRLEILQVGDLDRLIAQLGRDTFYRGTLTQRFDEVRLHRLEEADQRRLGVAVAHRCRQRTFVVTQDGLDSVVDNVSGWPPAYRAGLVEGLLLNDNGQFHPIELTKVATLVGSIQIEAWQIVVDQAKAALWAHDLACDLGHAKAVGAAMRALDRALPETHRPGWSDVHHGLLPS